MKRAVVVLALAVLAACNQQNAKQETTTVAAAEANLSIGPDGAAGVSTALPLTVEAITAAAPGYAVASVQDEIEGQPFTAITLSDDGEEVFRALPTPDGQRIHAIVTRSPRARGPAGDTPGTSAFGAAPATEVMWCGSQFVDGAPGFSCSTTQDGNFWRVYALPQGYDGPSEPFEGIDPDAALEAKLVEMRWIAPH